MKRIGIYIAAAIAGLAIVAILVSASIWPVINDVETGKTPEYPEIQPQYYTADPARVLDESKASVETLESWELVEADPKTGDISATRTTSLFGFVDDVLISVKPVTEFATQVNVRSSSRVGKGDFGQNARNIEEFFAELDNRLGAVKFDPNENSAQKQDDEKAPK